MEKLIIEKSKWFLFHSIFWGIILLPFIIGIFFIAYGLLRYKYDKIKIENGTFYSRFGLLNIDTKTIPLNKISMVSVKQDIIARLLNFGTIELQSSANNSTISYPFIKNADEIVKQINLMLQKF